MPLRITLIAAAYGMIHPDLPMFRTVAGPELEAVIAAQGIVLPCSPEPIVHEEERLLVVAIVHVQVGETAAQRRDAGPFLHVPPYRICKHSINTMHGIAGQWRR